MPTTEHTINDALAALLRSTRHAWAAAGSINSENTGVLKRAAKRPDILVSEPHVSPVAIETEVSPASTVEQDAMSRLGDELRTTGNVIFSSIAVRLPQRLRQKSGTALHSALESSTDLELALYTGTSPATAERWPRSGWITASISELSILTQSATVPPQVVDRAADVLTDGVSDAAGLLADIATTHPGALKKISDDLKQEDGEQTRRMAATILANAFVFMESLAGGPGTLAQIRTVEELRNSTGRLTKGKLLTEWRQILKINYWPIFDVARRILEHVPAPRAIPLITRLAETADRLLERSLMRSHDLTGAVFQRLIVDRKFLAAYYTTPAAAALLAGLAVDPKQTPTRHAWSDATAIQRLRIADFACGTGTLLSTVYQRIGQLHELAGGDAESLHSQMMASSLVGCDVLPAATHLTVSMLAGAHPTTQYTQSSILTVVFGRQEGGRLSLGSLDLLDPQGEFDIVAITAQAAGSLGESDEVTWKTLPHSSFDLLIMNPPFVRDTGHEGKKIGVPNPMFAAFQISHADQKKMAKRLRRLTADSSAHGNAGEASVFLVLANKKLKPDGIIALVMPVSLLLGAAWEKSRKLLASRYSELILVSIAGAADEDSAFSADTDMGECLIIGRAAPSSNDRATFVVLDARPEYPMLGASIANQIRAVVGTKSLRRLEDGPVGGTVITFGNDPVGYAVDAPLPSTGEWGPVRVADVSLAQSAWQLANGVLWLPGIERSEQVPLPIQTLSEVGGQIGPYHADINGHTADGGIRGPFDIIPLKAGEVPTYPVLWARTTDEQRTIAFNGDSQGRPRSGETTEEQQVIDEKIARVWASASHLHFARELRFNSQSNGMQYTDRKTVGGRSWISISLPVPEQERTLALWGNTTIGLLLHWQHANRQQSGRGLIGVKTLATLPVLDVSALSRQQRKAAEKLFSDMADRDLLSVYQMHTDPVRCELDERFGREVLGLASTLFTLDGPMDILRQKLAAEPSVRGNKQEP